MHLIDKQHVAGIQVGEQRCQITGLFNGRTAGNAQVHAQLIGDDAGQGGFTQAGRAIEKHMIQCFAPLPGRFNKHRQILFGFVLSDIFRKGSRTQGIFHCCVLRVIGRVNHPVFKIHFGSRTLVIQ